MKRAFWDTPKGQIHYRTEGTGDPLLLLHMVPCSSDQYSAVIPTLSPYFQVVAMDFPLYGDSYKPAKHFSIEESAQTTLDFMDALGIKRAHVAGHHTGAIVAAMIAAEHPERVNRLVLSGCPSWSLEEGLEWANDTKTWKPLEITPDGWFMRHIWQATIKRIPADKLDKAYEFALDYMKAAPRVEEGHQAAFRFDILPRLAKIKQPTLVVCGDQDVLFKYHKGVRERIPHAQGHVVKGAGGMVLRVMPQEWVEPVLKFLRS